ncbi:uncharacterized protein BDW47DRAFT_87163 [Aspergillus candidus]|uniref:Uncharacterized protein n=1 Tax=Aspergillus candidus TaxID=41067 RepID=A0A2I2EZI7_ASPCN|nr:hypothetical protein BDW47DRAFT_87163 [Aspergillus candidus]PLB33772.1 hypothetical protein BDW47DRAFT_87163 [Aspergillus candidus]
MSGLRGVIKEGWHPKGREGGKESWRGDFKGINQVAGWMGKGGSKDGETEERVSRPLSSLKDPKSFGPPPKHIQAHSPAAAASRASSGSRGLGAPLSQDEVDEQNYHIQQERQAESEVQEAAAHKPAPPPVPYRLNTTGLDTSTLPPPPSRRVDAGTEHGRSSPRSTSRPSLPPRVPPRTNSGTQSPAPPPVYSAQPPSDPYINEGATARLQKAGVSVPSLGIGGNSSQGQRDSNPRASASPTTAGSGGQGSLNELQTRFRQMRTDSAPSPTQAPSPPARRSTYGQAQSPAQSSPSSTLGDLRERHGDKIQAGREKISGINEKFGISSRFNNFVDTHRSSPSTQTPLAASTPRLASTGASRGASIGSSDVSAEAARKKRPPPPPPKKVEMRSMPVGAAAPSPPPLPLDTKPR